MKAVEGPLSDTLSRKPWKIEVKIANKMNKAPFRPMTAHGVTAQYLRDRSQRVRLERQKSVQTYTDKNLSHLRPHGVRQ